MCCVLLFSLFLSLSLTSFVREKEEKKKKRFSDVYTNVDTMCVYYVYVYLLRVHPEITSFHQKDCQLNR